MSRHVYKHCVSIMCGGRDRWTMDAILLTLPTAPSPVTTHCGLRTRVSSGRRRFPASCRAPWFGLAVSIPLLGFLGPTNLERLNCPGSSHDANMALFANESAFSSAEKGLESLQGCEVPGPNGDIKSGAADVLVGGLVQRKSEDGRREAGSWGSRQTAGNGEMCPCSKQPKADSSESASVCLAG